MCRIFDSHSPRGFVPAAEPVCTHASFIRFLLCILISSRLRAGLRIRLYRLCRRNIQVLPAASFPKAPGKSVFLFVFSCFGAHEIKVRGQYFFRLLTLPQYLCNFYVSSVITISEKISCFYFFCKSGQFYVQVVFMTIKKALPAPFRQSFPYFLKRRGFT